MFLDMALLVHHQGEMIDNIELNVGAANNYVEKANVQLNKAKKSHMAARKVISSLFINSSLSLNF